MKRMLTLLVAVSMCSTLCGCSSDIADGSKFNIESLKIEGNSFSIKVPVYDMVKSEYGDIGQTVYSNFKLDTKGNILSKNVSGSMSLTGTYSYEYRDNENIVMKSITTEDGNYSIHKQTYNEYGDLLKEKVQNSYGDNEEYKYTYEYDKAGRMLKSISFDDTGYGHVMAYEYDDRGLVLREVQTTYNDGINGPAGNTYIVMHEYDRYLNDAFHTTQKVGETETRMDVFTYDIVGYGTYSTDDKELNSVDLWKAFSQISSVPTPDTCISTISVFESAQSANSSIYKLDINKKVANLQYRMYQTILSDICDCTIEVQDNSSTFIYDEDNLCAIVTIGLNEEYGRYMRVDFLKSEN